MLSNNPQSSALIRFCVSPASRFRVREYACWRLSVGGKQGSATYWIGGSWLFAAVNASITVWR